MGKEFRILFKLKENHAKNIMKYVLFRGSRKHVILALYLVTVLLLSFSTILELRAGSYSISDILFDILFPLLALPLFFLFFIKTSSRRFAKDKMNLTEREMIINDSGVNINTHNVKINLQWSELYDVKITPKFLIFYLSKKKMNFIPIEVIEKDKDEILQFINHRGPWNI